MQNAKHKLHFQQNCMFQPEGEKLGYNILLHIHGEHNPNMFTEMYSINLKLIYMISRLIIRLRDLFLRKAKHCLKKAIVLKHLNYP